MLELTHFPGQNWLITPAALSLTEPRPNNINDQKWLLVLSGIASTEFSVNGTNFAPTPPIQSLHFTPDFKAPCNDAISKHGLTRPTGNEGLEYNLGFQVEQWSPFVALPYIGESDADQALFAILKWRPSPFKHGTDFFSNQPVTQIFDGIIADFVVADQDTYWYGASYNITLLGRIVFTHVIIT